MNENQTEKVGTALPATDWVEELAQKWERRLDIYTGPMHFEHDDIDAQAKELRECIKELRACAESPQKSANDGSDRSETAKPQ